jgi:hypothetical protein
LLRSHRHSHGGNWKPPSGGVGVGLCLWSLGGSCLPFGSEFEVRFSFSPSWQSPARVELGLGFGAPEPSRQGLFPVLGELTVPIPGEVGEKVRVGHSLGKLDSEMLSPQGWS